MSKTKDPKDPFKNLKNPLCPCSCTNCAWDAEGVDAETVAGAVPVQDYHSLCGSTQVVKIENVLHLERQGRFLPILPNTLDGKRVTAALQ